MNNNLEKHFNELRDCVKKCLTDGAKDRLNFISMRHGIICDLKRVGYIEAEVIGILKNWNELCYKTLPLNDFVTQVTGYVQWAFKKDAKASCKYFEKKECCLRQCEFIKRKREEDTKKLAEETVFTSADIEKHLREHEKCKNAKTCAIIYAIIDAKRIKLGLTREGIIFISFDEMRKALQEEYKYRHINKMFALRGATTLINSGLLERVVKGKAGCFQGHAHGYKLKTPEDVLNDDLLYYREDSKNNSNEDVDTNPL